ncbi:ATP-binding protein [Streptomyces sp. BH104]|uniref:ATP-binding protein n=1 Tax=Streptomyces sp. BH104 TaxID=3410407 RepID=UPI003BB627D5
MTEPSAIGVPSYSQSLPREGESAKSARALVSDALTVWGLEEIEDAAWLVISELVSNSVKHARMETIRVTVSRVGPARVRVQVTDRSHELPVQRHAEDTDVCGRGLAIVAAMSENWGVTALRWGKRVWADLEIKP